MTATWLKEGVDGGFFFGQFRFCCNTCRICFFTHLCTFKHQKVQMVAKESSQHIDVIQKDWEHNGGNRYRPIKTVYLQLCIIWGSYGFQVEEDQKSFNRNAIWWSNFIQFNINTSSLTMGTSLEIVYQTLWEDKWGLYTEMNTNWL